MPTGEKRTADLLAEAYTLAGSPETVLMHVEIEGEWRNDFAARMDEYFQMMRLRHRKKIFPIVIFLTGGAGEVREETNLEITFGREVNRFTYSTVALAGLSADDYINSDNPATFALTPLMRVSALGRAAQKAWSLRRIALSQENEARKAVLFYMAETYAKLNETEQEEFARLVETETPEVREMVNIYEERGIVKGIERGAVSASREHLLALLSHKFGAMPEAAARLAAIDSKAELDALFLRALDAKTPGELGLDAPA